MIASLAIKGHPSRGKELIEIFKTLGGHNGNYLEGDVDDLCYFINEDGYIDCFESYNFYGYLTLEEFLEKYPYKVGDKVLIPEYESDVRIDGMKWDGSEIQYEVFTDESEWYSAKELIELNHTEKTMKDLDIDEELCHVMYEFVKNHIGEITYSYKNLGFEDKNDMLEQIKSQVEVATWALSELLDCRMNKNYREDFFYKAYGIDEEDQLYSFKDSRGKDRFFVIDYGTQLPVEVEIKKEIIEITTWDFKKN